MLPKVELDKAVELAKKYDIGKLYLVGSIIHKEPDKVADYDFAIDEYNPEIFFKFYSKLFQAMSKTVDLIDLSGEQTLFKKIVRSEGKLVYEKI